MVSLDCAAENGKFVLMVWDDGPAMVHKKDSSGFGLRLVSAFVASSKGSIEFPTGTAKIFRVEIPLITHSKIVENDFKSIAHERQADLRPTS
jgi:two-component sensor histidine kinase